MAELFIFPYKAASKSAIALSDALDCYRINRTNSAFRYNPSKIVINWGWGGALPAEVARCTLLNKPEAVSTAVNKISTFKKLLENQVAIPKVTTDVNMARAWITQGYVVYARTAIEGSDGSGLSVHSSCINEPLPTNALLYTRGFGATASNFEEYRINVFKEDVVCAQKKVRESSAPRFTSHGEKEIFIRTTSNRWGFEVVSGNQVHAAVEEEAIAAINALGLDFGGVDVVRNGNIVYVLEVNTAPHLTPYACSKYAEAFKAYAESLS